MTTCYIQIDNSVPFLPEEVRRVGTEYGTREVTTPNDEVRNYVINSRVAILDYTFDNHEFIGFFKSGEWSKMPDQSPLFIARELLEFSP